MSLVIHSSLPLNAAHPQSCAAPVKATIRGNACLFSRRSLDEKCAASLDASLLRVNSYILLQVFEASNPESLPLLQDKQKGQP